MSLNESIDSLATGDYTVTRKAVGTFTDGIYSGGGSTTTFTIRAVQEPATGLQRVTGGFEMISGYDGQHTNDVRVLYTRTELKTRSQTTEADRVTINGRQYTVFRCEPWDLAKDASNNEVHYRALCTLDTDGSV
jgi:hypothetical protein